LRQRVQSILARAYIRRFYEEADFKAFCQGREFKFESAEEKS
jgi:hypothetical protein